MANQKHPGGRPLLFKSAKELQEKIDAYFADCDPHVKDITEWVEARDSKGALKKDENGLNYLVEVTHKVKTQQKPYTITGLANYLNTSRATLINYEDRGEFFNTIKAAKDKVEEFWENQLLGGNATGPIFNLKNNYDWRDKTEQDLNHQGLEVNISAEQSEQLIRARAKRSNS